ncbi:MAG TPA: alpha/beta hydrolase-fold protein [Planctomycetaceae bacterium]|nr:alpha/beta hydrolase-fold protein [Planctomycetaceae bacterium]
MSMHVSEIQIASHFADVLRPAGDIVGGVIFLHGYDNVTLRDRPVFQAALERHHLLAVCPHGPGCWWTDAVYPPFDPVLSPIDYLHGPVLDYLRETWQLEPPRIAVAGFEMGGQGALQLAYRHAREFPTVAAISPKVDFETWHGLGTTLDELFPDREAARQRTATLHIHPLNWPRRQLLVCDPADQYCLDGVVTLASKLSSSGIPFEQDVETTHGGYGWPYADFMADRVVTFLAQGIAEARLRTE